MRNDIGDLRSRLKHAAYDTTTGQLPNGNLSVSPLLGVGKNNPLNRVICELIASAQKQLTICTPYFNLPLPIIREVNRALARLYNTTPERMVGRDDSAFGVPLFVAGMMVSAFALRGLAAPL